jgi:hypothetical protein
MLLNKWQDDWLAKRFASWSWGALDRDLGLSRIPTPLELEVLRSWPNVDMIFTPEDDRYPQYCRCDCGRHLVHGVFDHDCYCADCSIVMKATVNGTEEFSVLDEIFTCPLCGKRGASRGIIQFPE